MFPRLVVALSFKQDSLLTQKTATIAKRFG